MLCFKEKQDKSTLYCLVPPASRSVNSMPLAGSTGWKKQSVVLEVILSHTTKPVYTPLLSVLVSFIFV